MAEWLNENLDYLLFSAATVAVFGGLDVWLRRRNFPGSLPRWAWPVAIVVLAAGWFFTNAAGEAERLRIEGFLEGIAPTYAQELERMGHAQVGLTTAPDDPGYLAMIEALKRWQKVNPTVADI